MLWEISRDAKDAEIQTSRTFFLAQYFFKNYKNFSTWQTRSNTLKYAKKSITYMKIQNVSSRHSKPRSSLSIGVLASISFPANPRTIYIYQSIVYYLGFYVYYFCIPIVDIDDGCCLMMYVWCFNFFFMCVWRRETPYGKDNYYYYYYNYYYTTIK